MDKRQRWLLAVVLAVSLSAMLTCGPGGERGSTSPTEYEPLPSTPVSSAGVKAVLPAPAEILKGVVQVAKVFI